MTRVSCPYCNTGFSLPEVPPGGRAVCPRCGDAFPVRSVVDEPAGANPQPAAPPIPPAPHPPGSAPRGIVRPLVIAVTLLGVGIALLYIRGGSKPKPQPPEPEQPPSAAATPPLQLRGLGYLPPNANLAFAVQPGPVLAYAARTNQDPTALLVGAGVPKPVLVTLTRARVSVADIDHLAGGVFVPDTDLTQLRAAVAVVLRKPLPDEDRFLEEVKAKRTERPGPPRYDVAFAGLPLKLAKAAETVWVFGWTEHDLDPAEAGGTTQLPSGLRDVIAGQVPADAAGWVAADSARWTEKKPVAFLLQAAHWTPDGIAVLAKGRAAAVGVTFSSPPRLRVAVRCSDTETAEKLRAYVKEKVTAQSATTDGAGEWVTIDTPTDPQAVLTPLKDFLEDAARR